MSMTIEYSDLSYQAYKKIKALILTNKLTPGTKILQERIAEDLGISRMPLHKAFQMLENELLVEHVPRKGFYVRVVNLHEIADAFECREAIEGLAARRATENLTDNDIRFLYELFLPFAKDPVNADISKYEEADFNFHNTLLLKSENKILQKMEMLSNIIIRTYQRGLIRGPGETYAEHMAIIDALKERNADKAEELLRNHFRMSRERILAMIAKEGKVLTEASNN
jgi:GntR family transcriptional regulator, vanillate catabolism transcriptional regulator